MYEWIEYFATGTSHINIPRKTTVYMYTVFLKEYIDGLYYNIYASIASLRYAMIVPVFNLIYDFMFSPSVVEQIN